MLLLFVANEWGGSCPGLTAIPFTRRSTVETKFCKSKVPKPKPYHTY